jgi:hypothetical protein
VFRLIMAVAGQVSVSFAMSLKLFVVRVVLRGWAFHCTPTKSLFWRGVGTTKKLLAI